jgi:hypothetical protein
MPARPYQLGLVNVNDFAVTFGRIANRPVAADSPSEVLTT